MRFVSFVNHGSWIDLCIIQIRIAAKLHAWLLNALTVHLHHSAAVNPHPKINYHSNQKWLENRKINGISDRKVARERERVSVITIAIENERERGKVKKKNICLNQTQMEIKKKDIRFNVWYMW